MEKQSEVFQLEQPMKWNLIEESDKNFRLETNSEESTTRRVEGKEKKEQR